MKKLLFLFAFTALMVVSCNDTNAQGLNAASNGSFSILAITGASNTSTTTLSGSADSVFLKSGPITGNGDLSIVVILTAAAATYTITGTCDLYGSMDGSTFVKAGPQVSLSATAPLYITNGSGAATQNQIISIGYFLPQAAPTVATQTAIASINGLISGSPLPRFNYYMVKIIQTTATTSSSVASAKWKLQRPNTLN